MMLKEVLIMFTPIHAQYKHTILVYYPMHFYRIVLSEWVRCIYFLDIFHQ